MRSISALALAALLSMALLAGCGKDKAAASGTTGSSVAQAGETGGTEGGSATVEPTGETGGETGEPGKPATETPSGEEAPKAPGNAAPGAKPGAAPGTPAAAPKGVDLKLRFKKGQKLAYKVVNKQTTNVKMGEVQQKIVGTTEMKQTYTVQSVDGGQAKLDLKASDFKVSMDGPAKGQEGNAKQMLEQLAKESVEISVGTTGEMQATGMSAMGLLMSVSHSGIGFMGLHFNDGAVPVGKSWNGELDMTKMPSMGAQWKNSRIPVKYTLKSVDNSKGTATIEFSMNGEPSFDFESPDPNQPADEEKQKMVKRTMKLRIKSSGTFVVRLSDGVPISVKSTQLFAGDTEAAAGGSQSQTQEVSVTLLS